MLRMPACSTQKRPANVRLALALDAKDLGESGQDPVFGAGLLRFGESALLSDTLKPGTAPSTGLGTVALWLGAGAAMLAALIFLLIGRRRRKQDKTEQV